MSTVDEIQVDKPTVLAIDRAVQSGQWVYFIRQGAYVKIGTARNVAKRFSEMQVGSPHKLILLGVIPGDRIIEKWVHTRVKTGRIRGEWFYFTSVQPFLDEFVKSQEDWREEFKDRGLSFAV